MKTHTYFPNMQAAMPMMRMMMCRASKQAAFQVENLY